MPLPRPCSLWKFEKVFVWYKDFEQFDILLFVLYIAAVNQPNPLILYFSETFYGFPNFIS